MTSRSGLPPYGLVQCPIRGDEYPVKMLVQSHPGGQLRHPLADQDLRSQDRDADVRIVEQ